MPGTFSPPQRVSNPDILHGTCVTHVSWCMRGSLTSGFLWSRWQGKRSRQQVIFTYLVRGPLPSDFLRLIPRAFEIISIDQRNPKHRGRAISHYFSKLLVSIMSADSHLQPQPWRVRAPYMQGTGAQILSTIPSYLSGVLFMRRIVRHMGCVNKAKSIHSFRIYLMILLMRETRIFWVN